MSVLVSASQLEERRTAALGMLAPLSASLAADLDVVLARPLTIPPEKARMTRRGGRCEVDGTFLEFDPFSPRAHRCPKCGNVFTDDSHYRWWIMNYQLWLAERAVHASVLFALRGDGRHRDFARDVLEAYADRYLEYPNRDNVLGPTRVFFSTYLESIWLLQLVVALDLLEMSTPVEWHRALGARFRDRVVAPSARIIAGYDEGLSNRQVWNNAALLAAARVLGSKLPTDALNGPSGLVGHLTAGLLADGTWYEGENYHLFAHRGLWYGVAIASTAGVELPAPLVARFDEAFATPFLTALPDFTFPARRDSQYRVSLRQWRFAELAELGHVRQPSDERLLGALSRLYDGTVERHETFRERSTAEAERNTPPTSLTRADLGWRSLLFAAPSLPPLADAPPGSVILRDQGLAILRREHGRTYVALDYGHFGAGHGHPDRLNFILVRGNDRWLDDVGTGSYVDPSLHWYRSTLAHNAPLVNGRSQQRVHGTLAAFEDRGAAGWVRAVVDAAAPGVRLERTIVAMPDYVVDELAWRADRDVQIDLPFHVDGALDGAGAWKSDVPSGGAEVEDGFGFLSDSQTATGAARVRLDARRGDGRASVTVLTDAPHDWWRATSFGAPGSGPTRFHFVRSHGQRGAIASVWDLTGAVSDVSQQDHIISVTLRDGTRHDHRSDADGWHIALAVAGATSSIDLGGTVAITPATQAAQDPTIRTEQPPFKVGGEPLSFVLGEQQYRRSEESWNDAGSPTATVSIQATRDALLVTVEVDKRDLWFAPQTLENLLDNENPDINSDGVQLHVIVPSLESGASPASEYTWLLVPEPRSNRVRVSARASSGKTPEIGATWRSTAHGYLVEASLPRAPFTDAPAMRLGVVVNETSPGRERRRGQLVLGGSGGEFVYLRGDRLSADRHLAFVFADD